MAITTPTMRRPMLGAKAQPAKQPRPRYSSPDVVAVPKAAARRRPKLQFAFVSVLGIGAIMLSQLALSILLGQGAYELSALKRENREVGRTAEALSEQIAVLNSPQNLGAAAEALGMVNVSVPAFIDVETGVVVGNVKAASAGVRPITSQGNLVANWALLNSGVSSLPGLQEALDRINQQIVVQNPEGVSTSTDTIAGPESN